MSERDGRPGWARFLDGLLRLAVGLVLGLIGGALAAWALFLWWREAPWQLYIVAAALPLLLCPLLTLVFRRAFWAVAGVVLTGE